MPPLAEAIILVLAPFAPLFSHWVWLHAQLLLLGAILAPCPAWTDGDGRITGHGAEPRRPPHELPSRLEPAT
jgi:hypothetical protein